MKIFEIFQSIEGEGIRQGTLVNFIRLAGCNLNCSYCDTLYAKGKDVEYTEMSILDIIYRLKEEDLCNTRFITITGGEPLFQDDTIELATVLSENNYFVNIETNGSYDISKIPDRILITLDYKTKSSGCNDKMLLNNLKYLKSDDVLKIVCCEDDFEDIEKFLDLYYPFIKSYIYLSPIYDKIELKQLVEFQKHLYRKFSFGKWYGSNLRVQIQLHKVIWGSEERGV